MDELEYKNRIPWYHFVFATSAAVFADLVQALVSLLPIIGLLLGTLVGLTAWICSALYFTLRDVSVLEKITARVLLKIAGILLARVFDILPLVGGFVPGATIAVVFTCLMVRAEDRAHNREVDRRREALKQNQHAMRRWIMERSVVRQLPRAANTIRRLAA